MIRTLSILAAAVAALSSTAVLAETAEEKGRRIAVEADRYDQGFGDTTVEAKMILRNKRGQESVRAFVNSVLEMTEDGDKSLNLFTRPRDIRGTALLTHTHTRGADDQWLFLPALKRVKRISSSNKSGAFVGSEFAYEDLTSQEVEKYTYAWLRDEACPGAKTLPCHVLERRPVDKKSGYTRQVAWLEQETYRTFKVDYYDRKNAFLKTLTFERFERYLDRYWRAHWAMMINHQTGKSTELSLGAFAFRTGLGERDFKPSRLKRLR